MIHSLRSKVKKFDSSSSEACVTPSDIWVSLLKAPTALGGQSDIIDPRGTCLIALHAPPNAVLEVSHPMEGLQNAEVARYELLISSDITPSTERKGQPLNMAAQRSILYRTVMNIAKANIPRKRGRPPKSKAAVSDGTLSSEGQVSSFPNDQEAEAAAAAGVLSHMNSFEDFSSASLKRRKAAVCKPIEVMVLPASYDDRGLIQAGPPIHVHPRNDMPGDDDDLIYSLYDDEGVGDLFAC